MKKMFTLLFALVSFTGLFAQYDKSYDNRRNDNDRNAQYDNRGYDNNGNFNRPDHAVVIQKNDGRFQPGNHYNNYDRNTEISRINRDYDRRIDEYRDNRRMNAYDRDRHIREAEKERREKLKAFGGGVLLGGILGVLLGSHL